MKRKILAGLVVAGVLSITGAAFAGAKIFPAENGWPDVLSVAQNRPQPPEFQQGKKPPISRDNRMPPPPGAHSPDKRPPMPPKSGDRRMPPPANGQRPPMSRDNRMPPPPNGQRPPMPQK